MTTAKEQKEYYDKNPKQRKKQREWMLKYSKKPESKKARKKVYDLFKKNNPNYHPDYQKKMLKLRKKKGLCTSCGKYKARKGLFTCLRCAKINRKYYQAHK